MAATFKLHIRAMDRDLYEGDCASLTVPLADGRLGILARHTPIAAAIVPGTMQCTLADGSALSVVCGHGILRFADNDALLLLDSAELPADVDAARAAAAEERARKKLAESAAGQERLAAEEDLARARNRVRASKREAENKN